MELQLPPGVVKTDSPSAAIGRYVDCPGCRWVNDKPEKIGGWEKFAAGYLNGVARGVHAYVNSEGFPLIGVGTHTNLYVIDAQGDDSNITPMRSEAELTDPFTTTNGSALVTVAHTAHGAAQGDRVTFSGASAVGGVTIDGDYVTQSVDTDSYVIQHSSAATSGATGGGTVTAQYDISIGTVSGTDRKGFGVGPFGAETFGSPRSNAVVTLSPRFWSLGNYGNFLIASPTRGTIYLYNDVTQDRAEALENAPADCLFVFVTAERFIMALREDMYVQWPDQDDPTDWTPTTTNTANTRRLSAGSELVAGTALAQGSSIVWTDTTPYIFQYTGGSFIYDSRSIGEDCGLIGPSAFCIVDSVAFWMSRGGFHSYSGYLQDIPRSEEIADWVFANITEREAAKTICFHNPRYREVWWIFPANSASEPNRYVMVNLKSFAWANGNLERVGHTRMVGDEANPLLTSFDGVGGYIYRHETGVDADGQALPTRLKTGMIRMNGAGTIMDITGIAPDFQRLSGTMSVTATGRDRPNSSVLDQETVTIDEDTEMEDMRISGRHIELEFYQSEIGGDFRLGVPIIEVGDGGVRR